MSGLFGDLFDFDGDGELDAFERAMEWEAISETVDADEDEEDDDLEDLRTELELSGLDIDELEFMSEDERREALEEAGLDPDEYDF